MPVNTQDFVHGVDFTGINPVAGADFNNGVDLAAPYQDSATEGKGLNLVTKDTALDTPDVPNAAIITKWKKYLWIRVPHATATEHTPSVYAWNDDIVSDVTFLKWVITEPDLTQLTTDVATALADSANALATANLANINAGDAQIRANNASNDASDAKATAETASANATTALANAATAQTTATAAQTAANNASSTAVAKKDINAALNPDVNSLSRLRTNELKTGVEWYQEKNNYALVVERYANGNDGPAGVNGAAQDRVLNTIINNMSPAIAIFNSKYITFTQFGDYYIRARAPVTNTGQAKHVLAIVLNDVGATVLLHGSATNHNTDTNPNTSYAQVEGKISLADGDAVKLSHYIFDTTGAITLGKAVGAGLTEQY